MNLLVSKNSNKNKFLKIFKSINWDVICILFLFFFIGCIVLYSASGGKLFPLVINHIIKFIFSAIVFILILIVSHNFIKKVSFPFYIISIVLLVFLMFFGAESAGSKRWISFSFFSIQPSEFAKIFLVLAISKYYSEVAYIKNNSFIIF